jgi:hypothetical protein
MAAIALHVALRPLHLHAFFLRHGRELNAHAVPPRSQGSSSNSYGKKNMKPSERGHQTMHEKQNTKTKSNCEVYISYTYNLSNNKEENDSMTTLDARRRNRFNMQALRHLFQPMRSIPRRWAAQAIVSG